MREDVRESIAPSDEQLAEVMAREPSARLLSVEIPDGPEVTILARPIPRATFDRVQSLEGDKRRLVSSIILRDCLLWPERATWETLVDRYPGINDAFAGRLLRLAGAGIEADVKKP